MIQTYNGKEPYIFISYSHKDSDAVLPLVQLLADNGFRVWYDNGIEAGTEWPEYIAERLMSCAVAIIFMSRNAQDSHNCRREVNFAIELKKELLVVYLEDFEASPGMRMQLGTLQALHRINSTDEEIFRSSLLKAQMLQRTREEQTAPPPQTEQKKKPTAKPLDEAPSISIEKLKHAIEVLNKALKDENHSGKMKPAAELSEKVIQHLCNRQQLCAPLDIVGFMDTTLLHSGNSGYLLTNKALIYTEHFNWKFKRVLPIHQIASAKQTSPERIAITFRNGKTFDYFFNIYTKEFMAFFDALLQ